MLNLFRSFNSVVETEANIHAKDDNIGMNAQISLSWKFQIINDLTMFARCGNQQHEMNTNNWVWNAQIIYNSIKRELMTKPKDLDLLHQHSNTQYTMNKQGVVTFFLFIFLFKATQVKIQDSFIRTSSNHCWHHHI